MAFALWPKKISCPNCGYEGDAKVEGASGVAVFMWLLLLIASFVFFPLFLVSIPMLLWLLMKPAKQICPECKYQYPIPLKS